MQAIVCHLSKDGLKTAVPQRHLKAASTYAAVDYLDLCYQRLCGNAEKYGYDIGSNYTLIVQTWDRAQEDVLSFAYGRANTQRDFVKLIPDVYFLISDGYARLRAYAARGEIHPWSKRLSTIVWRGSVTGSGRYKAPLDIPRVRLCVACRDISDTDVALFQIHETMLNVFPPAQIEAFARAECLWGNRWQVRDFGRYKFVIDIDGHANAWGLVEKMILGCCVLKVTSPYEQWFYENLKPWRHYIPIRSDLHDLQEKVSWCRENQAECEWIAHNGAILARSLTVASAVELSCVDLMKVASPQIGSFLG